MFSSFNHNEIGFSQELVELSSQFIKEKYEDNKISIKMAKTSSMH